MFDRLTHILNAAIFGSCAWVIVSGGLNGAPHSSAQQSSIATRTVATVPVNPVRTISETPAPSNPVRTVSEAPANPVQTLSEVPAVAPPANPVRTVVETARATDEAKPRSQRPAASDIPAAPAAAAASAGPRVFSPSMPLFSPTGTRAASPVRTVDAVVPPIARKRPKSEPVVADVTTPAAKPAPVAIAAAPAGDEKASRRADAAAKRGALDKSSRSALGAPMPPAPPTCAAGLKLDPKSDTCVKASGKKGRATKNETAKQPAAATSPALR